MRDYECMKLGEEGEEGSEGIDAEKLDELQRRRTVGLRLPLPNLAVAWLRTLGSRNLSGCLIAYHQAGYKQALEYAESLESKVGP